MLRKGGTGSSMEIVENSKDVAAKKTFANSVHIIAAGLEDLLEFFLAVLLLVKAQNLSTYLVLPGLLAWLEAPLQTLVDGRLRNS